MGAIANNAALDPTQLPRPLLGANVYQTPIVTPMGTTYALQADRRQHPFFRTELLQKVMNLTTVRTQQFAVYVTVGFFEVKKEGNANTLQPDILGAEIDPGTTPIFGQISESSQRLHAGRPQHAWEFTGPPNSAARRTKRWGLQLVLRVPASRASGSRISRHLRTGQRPLLTR